MSADRAGNKEFGNKQRQKRGRSTIKFPYSDLGAAIALAETIKSKAGLSCDTDQLAAWMGHSVTGGTFRSRYSAARMFGLIRADRAGNVELTALGHDVLNPQKADRAKATAFLNVDLFRKVYETQKGHALPPPTALKRMVGSLGVTLKQENRARQTFTKSAEVAKFIDPQTGVFIQPGFPSDNGTDHTDPPTPDDPNLTRNPGGGDGDDDLPREIDPIILGLLNRLPSPGNVWPMDERELWLELLAGSFKLVYKVDEQPSENQAC